jgi:hypothetical protein
MKQYIHRPGTSAYKALERESINRGATKFGVSTKGNSKYFVIYKGKTIHFGSRFNFDSTWESDEVQRERKIKQYKARHGKILLKDGRPAYKVKGTPAYFSWHLLW